jgi:hypothetical protein
MNIGTPKVQYTKNYTGSDITSVTAEVRIPATDGDVSGYVTLGSIDGWYLSEDDTKLTKEYKTNQTEIIEITMVGFNGTTFEGATTFQSIEIYDVTASAYVRVNVDYVRESDGSTDKLVYANVIASIKNAYVGTYAFSKNNAAWVVSEDGTSMSRDIEINGNFTEPCDIYPSGETDTEENRITETVSFRVDCVGLFISPPNITYEEKKFDDEVVGAEITITVPYTIGDIKENAILGNVGGWDLKNNNTQLVKTYYKNANDTIKIPVIEANGYSYSTLYFNVNIAVNEINYKRIVKGRCNVSSCLYDVYTKAEIENLKLQVEEKINRITDEKIVDKYAVAEAYLTTTAEYQSLNNTKLKYPSGFNKENTYVLNARFSDGTMYVTQHLTALTGNTYQETLGYSLRDEGIILSGRLPYYAVGTTIKLQFLLMRVE